MARQNSCGLGWQLVEGTKVIYNPRQHGTVSDDDAARLLVRPNENPLETFDELVFRFLVDYYQLLRGRPRQAGTTGPALPCAGAHGAPRRSLPGLLAGQGHDAATLRGARSRGAREPQREWSCSSKVSMQSYVTGGRIRPPENTTINATATTPAAPAIILQRLLLSRFICAMMLLISMPSRPT